MTAARRSGLADGPRRVVKGGLRRALAGVGRQRWTPREPSLVLLMYHRVLPKDHPDRAVMQPGMVVAPETLRMHLGLIRELFEPVPLADWTARAAAGAPLPRKACALAFDDGWRDNHTHAYPLLAEAGVPATIFLTSALVGTDRGFWPERLARLSLAHAAAVPPALAGTPEGEWLRGLGWAENGAGAIPGPGEIDAFIERAKVRGDDAVAARLDRIEAAAGAPAPAAPDLLDWDQVAGMAKSGLVAFGSHTRHHVRLTDGVPPEVAEDEVVESKREIEERGGGPVTLFCYPNGDRTPAAERLVRAHYAGSCTTERGWNRARGGPHDLRRIGIHDDVAATRTDFLARLSAWI